VTDRAGLIDLLRGHSESVPLDRAALQVAAIEYPDVDVGRDLAILDAHADAIRGLVADGADGEAFVRAANRYLFATAGFEGESADYYNPDNSCLNRVLAAHKGIPITLSIVYMELARRLGRPVYGIGLPGHYLVQYDDGAYSTYIDVFHRGALLRRADCLEILHKAGAAEDPGDAVWLARTGKRQTMFRVIRNLCGCYLRRSDYAKALRTLDLLVEAEPDSADERRNRAALHIRMRNLKRAKEDLEMCLLLGQDGKDREQVEHQLHMVRQSLSSLN
jgi:regulator of sirC expression with transglutaminase-like and TPR domain